MILRRLYELAEREGLIQDPAFDSAPIAVVIQIGANGEYRGMIDQRTRSEEPPKRKGGKSKVTVGKGKLMSVPVRPVVLEVPKPTKVKSKSNTPPLKPRWKTTDPAAAGQERPAVFLADTIARVLPVQRLIDDKDRAKCDSQRSTFWRFLDHVAATTNDPALNAMQRFGEWLKSDPAAPEQLAAEVDAKELTPSQLCTFAWLPDENVGQPILARPDIRCWWREFFAADRASQESGTFRGRCQVTDAEAAIPSSIKTRINGLVAIGCRADAYLLTSVDASESYGLEGAATGMVSAQGVDGFTRALNALIANQVPGQHKSCLRVGGTMLLFWARDKDPSAVLAFETADPEQVARLIQSTDSGKHQYSLEANDFYCLTLSGNSSRIVVRDYLEAPLSRVETHLGEWFRDLAIIDPYTNETTSTFPLWMLANSTIRNGDDLPPDLTAMLVSAALNGTPVSQNVLAACLRRMRVEVGSSDDSVRRHCFRPARMGLIQLILKRLPQTGVTPMSAVNVNGRGYECGQLLAFLSRCQSPRDFGASAQVLDRYFGSASTAPRSVFPYLLRLNRHHIRKVRDDNVGFALALEQELEERLAPFRSPDDSPPDFPAVLSLPEQGRFALGFYQQRAAYRTASAERKLAAAAANA
jgi:CRISPR-associated protein Csd1